MQGGAWTEIGTLRGAQISDYPSYNEMKVSAIERFGDKLIISHTGTHYNGNPISPVFTYNTKTGDIQNIPLPSGITTSNYDEAYVKVVGDSIYFISTHERLTYGRQRFWILTFTQATAWQYTFTGDGNWSNAQNWAYGFKPPEHLPVGKEILINPAGDGECVLDVQKTIHTNAAFKVAPGKRFRVTGDLIIGN